MTLTQALTISLFPISALIASMFAHSRRHPWLPWFFAGLVATLPAVIVAICLPMAEDPRERDRIFPVAY